MSTKPCPWCSEEILEAATVCKHCGTPVVQRCVHCTEVIHVRAGRCPTCRADLTVPGPEKAPPPPEKPAAVDLPVGERRNIILTLLLSFITLGIYQMFVVYWMGRELNDHGANGRLSPGRDLILTIVTCGLWGIYTMYAYPAAFRDITEAEGGRRVDLPVICCLLMAGSAFFPPLYFVGPLLLQDELNSHWEEHV